MGKTATAVTKAPRGKPKSGRVWKTPKNRASSINKNKRDSLLKKNEVRDERKRVSELSKVIRDNRVQAFNDKRTRAEENKKRKEENARKSEIVQVIKSSKIKRMKKKLLRNIEKRDTTIIQKD